VVVERAVQPEPGEQVPERLPDRLPLDRLPLGRHVAEFPPRRHPVHLLRRLQMRAQESRKACRSSHGLQIW
jgi:hypothetical protein